MEMEFDNGVLSLENAQGCRWIVPNAEKPRLGFAYDALSVTKRHAMRRFDGRVQPLTRKEVDEVAAFVAAQSPPPASERIAADLKTFAYGLINAAVGEIKFANLLDVQIAARTGSTDLRAGIARQALAYVDSVWNTYRGVIASLDETAESELKPFSEYANMMPMLPRFGGRDGATVSHDPGTDASAAKAEAADRDAPLPCSRNVAGPPRDAATLHGSSIEAGRPVKLVTCAPGEADFANIVDTAFVFDDVFPAAQLQVYETWAMQSPHWMLSNSSHDEHGAAKHRIWGASFIGPWRAKGWAGLPPVLLTIIATLFQRLDVTITEPEYIGLNGQTKDQTASMHTDCADDSPDDMSILFYFGEDTDGDLILYDKADTSRQLHRIAFAPNRVVVFDGSIPHQAFAPTDDKFRMSMIVRGKYKVGATDLVAARGGA